MPPSSQLGFVLAIEGWEYLVHSGGTADNAAVIAAWGGSGWTQAVPGLKVRGTVRQRIQPWAATLDVPTLTFEIQSTEDDLFGRAAWHSRPGYRSRLRSPFIPEPDGTGELDTDITINEDGLVNNALYIGGQRLRVEQFASQRWTVLESGVFHPFLNSNPSYFNVINTPAQQGFDAAARPMAQDVPLTWIGRKVGLYIHTIKGGSWNTRSAAILDFAGRIVSMKDDPKAGATIVGCEDLRGTIRDAVLMRGQWRGLVQSGVRLEAGDRFQVQEDVALEFGGATVTSSVLSDPLLVVASGASGNFELNAGYYDLGDFIASLNTWLTSITGGGVGAGEILGRWSAELTTLDGTAAFRFKVTFPAGTTINHQVRVMCSDREILDFLGFDRGGTGSGAGEYKRGGVDEDWYLQEIVSGKGGQEVDGFITALAPPYVTKPFQGRSTTTRRALRVDLEAQDGTWIDHQEYLPTPFDSFGEEGESWSLLRLGERLYFGRYQGTFLSDVIPAADFGKVADRFGSADYKQGRTIQDADDRVEIFQVVVLLGSFADLLTKLLVSTSGNGLNHPDFDVFPRALGGPSIPWGLLGEDWLDSIRELDQATESESTMIVLDRPRKLLDIILPELLLRFAWIVFKSGGYRLVSPPTPNPLSTNWTLDETDKAAPAGQEDMLVAQTDVTPEFLVNIVKVDYNRGVDGKFTDTLIVRDESSISVYGDSQIATIQAVNSYADAAATGASVEALASSLLARVLPAFSRPMKTVSRPIAPSLYAMAPGDTVTLSDLMVRNPVNGRRGLVSRACVCVAVSHGYGHEGGELFGEVTLLFTDEDRTFPVVPSADVDMSFSGTVNGITFTNGYASTAAGGPALKLVPYTFSRPVDDLPDVSHFPRAAQVRIYEIDPALVSGPQVWDRQVVDAATWRSIASSYLLLTSDIVSPAWDPDRFYRVTYQRYSEVNDDQKLNAYLADVDGLIQDEAEANTFGEDRRMRFQRSVDQTVPYRLPAQFRDDDGRPLEAGLMYDHAVNLNNLLSHTCAQQAPQVLWQYMFNTLASDRLVAVFPFFFGLYPQRMSRRTLMVSPILQISLAAATCFCRVTSSANPPHGNRNFPPSWAGAKKQVEFTRTGSTADAAAPARELTVVPSDVPGCTWISVELRTSVFGAIARWRGFQRFFLSHVKIPP